MDFTIRPTDGKKNIPKSGKRYTLTTSSHYSCTSALRNGFYLTAFLLLPDGTVRIMYPCNDIPQNSADDGEESVKFTFRSPHLVGDGVIDVFQTLKPILEAREIDQTWDVFKLIERIASNLNSLKKCGLVLQSDIRLL